METWPLTGRHDVLDEAGRAVVAGRSVLLVGPQGIGRTRCSRELLARIGPPHVIEQVQASAATATIPLGALWSLGLELPADASVSSMASAAAALAERAGDGRLVIGIDDADHLDPVSAVVLAEVLGSGRAIGVLTYRQRALAGDPLVARLQQGDADWFELAPLDEAEVAQLLESTLGGPVDGAAVRRLHELSGGNPQLLREVVHSARSGGELDLRRGWWSLVSTPRPTAPLVDLVAGRIDRLQPEALEVMEFLALSGPLELRVLEALDAGPAVEQLEEAGLVHVDRTPPVVGIAHPLHGEVVLDRLTVSRRRRHVRRLSVPLVAGAPDRFPMAVAIWMLDGHVEADPDLLLEACRRVRGIDDGLAARFARSAVEAGGGAPAILRLGEALVDLGDGESAVRLLASVDAELLSEPERVRVGIGHVASMAWLQHDLDGALRALDELTEHLSPGPASAELHGVAAGVNLFAGRLDRAMVEAERASEQGEAAGVVRSMVLLTELVVAGVEGRSDLVEPLLAEASSMVTELFLTSPRDALRTGMALLMARILALEPGPLEQHGSEVYELGVALDVPLVRCAGALALGVAALFSGRMATAERRLREAVALGEPPHFGFVPYAADLAVVCAARRGRDVGSIEDPLEGTWDGQRMAFFEAERLRAAARREWSRGRSSAAVAHARTAADLAAERGQLVFECLALHDLADFGEAESVADRLAELATTSAFAAAAAARADGLRRSDPDAVLAAAAQLAAAGFALDALVAARDAERLARAAGRNGSALSAAAAAELYASSCEDPPASDADSTDGLLTTREREVATLAAEGRRDAEIAAELFVSVRTVQTHLARVYAKLGISGRKDLASLLGGNGD